MEITVSGMVISSNEVLFENTELPMVNNPDGKSIYCKRLVLAAACANVNWATSVTLLGNSICLRVAML